MFFRNFAVIGAVVIWAGVALDMVASANVPPATARQCGEYPLWCFYSQHPSFGWLGAIMLMALLAGFATLLFYEPKPR